MFAQNSKKRFNPFGVEVGKITETTEELRYWQKLKKTNNIAPRDPKFSLERLHRKTTELSFVLSLALTIAFLMLLRGSLVPSAPVLPEFVLVQVEQIPPTKQERRTPPPPRPQVAIPSDDQEIPEEETIAVSELRFDEIPEPPAPPSDEVDASSDIFVAFDTPPVPVGGWKALYQNLEYPLEARKAGIEGRVLINVQVDESGEVVKMEVLRGVDVEAGLEKAAMDAIQKLAFQPALQRDKPVKVWVTVPVRFSLTSNPS